MVQIVLSIEEKYNKMLRQLAKSLHNNKKGAMSEIVEEGIEMMNKAARRKSAYLQMLDVSKNARDLGVKKFIRAEAYD